MVSVRDENGGGAGTEKRPFGTVVASAVNGFRALAREHVDLLKLEMSEAASVRARGVGMMGAAFLFAVERSGFLSCEAAMRTEARPPAAHPVSAHREREARAQGHHD